MKKIGIFYGSTTGTTEEVANQIAKKIGISDEHVHNVGDADASALTEYDVLLLGSSTWGAGDLQDEWEDFLPEAKEQNLAGKTVAIFGCGNPQNHPDTFCGSLATIKEEMAATNCTFVGETSTEGYEYDETPCEQDGKFIGLLLDEVNEDDKTPARIDAWLESLKSVLN